MKHLLISILTSSLFLIEVPLCAQKSKAIDYTKYVNTFIGTTDNGHTFPGACRPFGMVQPSPVTNAVGWKYCSEYDYKDSIIWGFTQTHLNGTGCMDLGDILLMPVTGKSHRAWDGYRSHFLKSTEAATPGYYTVELADTKVKAEITATIHAAFYRYTYHSTDTASILIDLQHGPSWTEQQYHSQVSLCNVQWKDASTLTGHVRNKVWVEQDYFFVIKFNRPVTNHFNLPMAQTEKGQRIIASFNMKPNDQLLVKVGLSTTSVEGAMKNLQAEIPAWNFNAIKTAAHNDWNNYLKRIEVTGSNDTKTNFYTCLYHALIQPNQISDIDGKYRNAIDKVVEGNQNKTYSTFSLWDTYRAAHPFYTLMYPERVNGFINSMIEQGEAQGFLPIWALWGKENYCMIANHGVPVIVDAYCKGFKGFNAERAFSIIKRTETVSHQTTSDWETYMKYGYFPADIVKVESVSRTLESVFDDYAAMVMAKRMGKTEDAAYFAKRADYYKNLFDKSTRFMRPKLSDGNWKSPFSPNQVGHASSVGGDYTEGNAWQYTWHVQHDVPGLINLLGGKKAFVNKLDSLFTLNLKTEEVDVTGLIGQYAHGNEPSHHIIYLYTMAGRPDKAQELIRKVFDTQYKNKPDGLCGNDDCGQMSAWFMFSAMGFYPVNPVNGEYVFGAPQYSKFVLHLNNGKTFTILANGLSTVNKYIGSIVLNGKPYLKNYISHKDIVKGGTLVYNMQSAPKQN
jgi:predicted alpha-1,2-mannosidase